jgi:[methyl-Co(III) methanol-specific corrinoid protein]:coenzyme M methyltransferase
VYSVLHICGKTNDIVTAMMEAGPTAISVEQKNDVAESRKKLGPDAIIFGNMDAYNILVSGSEEAVRQAVRKCIDDGVSGVWPGCDIWPTVPPQNMKAMMEETISYGGKK